MEVLQLLSNNVTLVCNSCYVNDLFLNIQCYRSTKEIKRSHLGENEQCNSLSGIFHLYNKVTIYPDFNSIHWWKFCCDIVSNI